MPGVNHRSSLPPRLPLLGWSCPCPTPPQFPRCTADSKLKSQGVGAVSLRNTTVRKSKAIFFLVLARVACLKVKIKPRGERSGPSVLLGAGQPAVASVAENIGSGHACLCSNPITPCGWPPKIAAVSSIITVQHFHHRPLIVPWTQSSLTPPLPASQGHLG